MDDRTPVSVWDDIKATTDIPEPGEVTDMDGCDTVAGDATPLPDGDGERDCDEDY